MPHTAPTASDLKARYPAFADTLDATVDIWITDAQRIVTTSWDEADYAPAIMALAAHSMALGGLEASGSASLPAGVTRFRSASIDVSITERAANASVAGGYGSTRYGQEFEIMLRRNIGGMRLVAAGRTLCAAYP